VRSKLTGEADSHPPQGRARRKKCNEQRPRCEKCIKSNRACSWPAAGELFDRRHRRVSKSPTWPSPSLAPEIIPVRRSSIGSVDHSFGRGNRRFFICREIAINSDLFNSDKFKSDLELDCFRHFIDGFLPLLLLSSAHPGFQSQYIPEVVDMLLQFDGLKDVALACGASHMHLVTGSSQMNEAGIKYYSRAVSHVNRALSNIDWSRDSFNDALLVCITFLYIHGVSSRLSRPVPSTFRNVVSTNRDIFGDRCSQRVHTRISPSI
jgi:hypothetical protein